MQSYKRRLKETIIEKHLGAFPCVALLGARQVGKSTLARKILGDIEKPVYLDLEDPRDYAKLRDPLSSRPSGTPQKLQSCVAAFVKGTAINCKLRLDLNLL